MQEDNSAAERRLKVYSKYFNRSTKSENVVFPEIRLCGKWLQETGFHDGQTIIVRHEKNKIIITLDNEADL